jgi:PRC-barrel domain
VTDSTWHAAGCRRVTAAFVCLWTLSGCHSAPVAERPPAQPTPAAAAESPAQEPATSGGDAADELRADTPIETPIVAPPCLPVETAPKPKRRSAPKPQPPASSAPPSGAGEASAPPSGSDAEVRPLDSSIVSVLGKKVEGAKGEDLGRVVDVLADARGRVRIAVIEFGGFLGVGIRRVAVDWSLLRFPPGDEDKFLTLSVNQKKLQSAPEYKNSNNPQALMAPQVPAAAPSPSAAEGKK